MPALPGWLSFILLIVSNPLASVEFRIEIGSPATTFQRSRGTPRSTRETLLGNVDALGIDRVAAGVSSQWKRDTYAKPC
jgi:hypothetical protein